MQDSTSSGATAQLDDFHPRFEVQFSKYGWEEENDDHWVSFYTYWRGKDYDEETKKTIIPLAYDAKGIEDPNFRLACAIPVTQHQLYIRDSYRVLVKDIFEFIRKSAANKDKGLVISGQPGTGKSVWLWFMLLFLIMKNEHVVFHFASETRFFYKDKVYLLNSNFPRLPMHPHEDIWSLIDSDVSSNSPPPFLTKVQANLFPIHASSPNTKRYSAWKKLRSGYVWGMPLWTKEELIERLKIDKRYAPFMGKLRRALEDRRLSALDGSSVLDEAMDIDRPHSAVVQSPAEKAIRFAEGCQNNADMCFYKLQEEAILTYGGAPPDILEAVFEGCETLEANITSALTASESILDDLMYALAVPGSLRSMAMKDSPFYQLFSIQPIGRASVLNKDEQLIPQFKSERIGQQVMSRLGHLQARQAISFISTFKLFPVSSAFAGWIFGGLAHEQLASASERHLYTMTCPQAQASEKFVIYDTNVSFSQILGVRGRQISHDVTLSRYNLQWDNEKRIEEYLCVPQNRNNPLFDSFYVEFHNDFKEAVIWIFQATISHEHDGSSKDFDLIKSIRTKVSDIGKARRREMTREKVLRWNRRIRKATLQKRLEAVPDTKVKLNYVLVCPSPKSKCKWRIPTEEWEGCEGDVFCQFINVTAVGVEFM